MENTAVANHHAGQGTFSGAPGLVVGLSFLVGRKADATLACELTDVGPNDCVLDVGSGPGVAAREARRRGALVVGVEPAAVMLRLAGLFPRDGVTFQQGTAEQLPLDGATVTVAWSLATAHHWTSVGQGLAELRRVLRPGGRLLILERRVWPGATGHASHGWTDEQAESFSAACRDAGFGTVEVEQHTGRRGTLLAVTAVAPE